VGALAQLTAALVGQEIGLALNLLTGVLLGVITGATGFFGSKTDAFQRFIEV
jgi:ABC-type microcin C transport system permease subunit YejE